MNWIEVTVTVTPEAVEAVGNILMEAGAGGVVERASAVRVAYFPDAPGTQDLVTRIKDSVDNLFEHGLDPGPAHVTWRTLAEASWADAWKDHFHPVRLGTRLVVRPTWRNYEASPGDIVLDLDPGMAFGTGTHPTTAMCVRALEKRVRSGDTVIDIGTGSGILAIAAARLGAERVFACDTDPVAVRVARENAGMNGVADRIEVIEGSWPELIRRQHRAHIVVANIIASVIETMIPDADQLLIPGGLLVASGIATFRRAGVVAAFSQHGWDILHVHTEGDWVAIEAVRRGPAVAFNG